MSEMRLDVRHLHIDLSYDQGEKFDTMEHQFEPLKNDLILRTALGEYEANASFDEFTH